MTALIDTNAFLWWCLNDHHLSDYARSIISDRANNILVSAAVGWEIAIKWQLGKLPLPEKPADYVPDRIARTGLSMLDITLKHTTGVQSLPAFHRDPFDRILISQATIENVPIITADAAIAQYDVRTLW